MGFFKRSSKPEAIQLVPQVDDIWDDYKVKYLMGQIRQNVSLLSEDYERLFIPLIQKFRNHVYDLPGSDGHHHNNPSGLFVHSLEVCNSCARTAGGLEFLGSETPEYRKANTERWLVASAVSGLLHDLGKIASDQVVKCPNGIEWNPFLQSLKSFKLEHSDSANFFIPNRTHKSHEYYSLALAHTIIPTDLLGYLGASDRRIIPTLFMSIAGIQFQDIPLFYDSLVNADKASVVENLGTASKAVPMPSAELPLAQPPSLQGTEHLSAELRPPNEEKLKAGSLADQMKSAILKLILDGHYHVNVKSRDRGVFWYDQASRAWATWPSLYAAIEKLFIEYEFKGYPKQSGVFLASMCTAALCEKKAGESSWTAKLTADQSNVKLTLVHFIDTDIINAINKMKKNDFRVMPVAYDIEKEIKEGLGGSSFEAPPPSKNEQTTNRDHTDSNSKITNTKSELEIPKLSDELAIDFSSGFLEYCDSKSEAGDVIFEIAMNMVKGGSYFMLDEGLLILEWPKFSTLMGDDEDDIVALLSKEMFLSKSSKELKIKGSGLASFSNGGRKMEVLIMSKTVSTKIINEVKTVLSTINHSQISRNKNKKPNNQKKPKKNNYKNSSHSNSKSNNVKLENEPIKTQNNSIQDKVPRKTRVKAVFDEYLSENLSKYDGHLALDLENKHVSISCLTKIIRALLDSGELKESDRQVVYSMSDKLVSTMGSYKFSFETLIKTVEAMKENV